MQDSSIPAVVCKTRATLTLILLLVSGSLWADGAALQRCRLQVDPAVRFACYEAIAVPVATTAATQKPAVAPPLPGAEQFGLEQKTAPVAARSVISSIAGRFNGWEPNERILLTNGQVWQISDDSRGALVSTDPKVTVRRGALGAFYLDIEGTNRSPKVRRTQ